ncbi:MAG TPA: hypothetical protein VFZ27_04920, partial [Terriglobia bacterium]|nr:hypothetical protein [Terriglobia bacterium]
RRDALLFGEFTGSVLLEVAQDFDVDKLLGGIPHAWVGEVMPEPRISLAESGEVFWQDEISHLAEAWSKPFREVLE